MHCFFELWKWRNSHSFDLFSSFRRGIISTLPFFDTNNAWHVVCSFTKLIMHHDPYVLGAWQSVTSPILLSKDNTPGSLHKHCLAYPVVTDNIMKVPLNYLFKSVEECCPSMNEVVQHQKKKKEEYLLAVYGFGPTPLWKVRSSVASRWSSPLMYLREVK